MRLSLIGGPLHIPIPSACDAHSLRLAVTDARVEGFR